MANDFNEKIPPAPVPSPPRQQRSPYRRRQEFTEGFSRAQDRELMETRGPIEPLKRAEMYGKAKMQGNRKVTR